MYYSRILEKGIRTVSKQFPVLLLTGPRQCGKTTLLQHLCETERTYVTLDDLSLRELAQEDPILFLNQYKSPLLIDEIQYAPKLLPYIKIQVDKNRVNGEFWLTGSQQYHMMKDITESLAGRIAILNLLGFSQKERYRNIADSAPFLPMLPLKDKRSSSIDINNIYKDIWKGSLPVPAIETSLNYHIFYNSYLQTYLQRDIRDLSQVGNLEQFARFVKACAARTGQLLNYSDLAKDVDISVTTAKNWISLLIASFQIILLPPFHSNITKRLIKTPKMYFLDTGLCSFLTGWSSAETLQNGAMNGSIFETYVVTEIIKSWWFNCEQTGFYFYRDKDKKEIDLLIERDNILYPVEVKKAATVKRTWINNFRLLDRLPYNRGRGVVICLCNNLQPIDSMNKAIPVTLIG